MARATPPQDPTAPPESLVLFRLHAAVTGLKQLYWGLLLFSVLLAINLGLKNPPPTHALGLLLMLSGGTQLLRRMPRGTAVRRSATHLLLAILMTLYFLPFLQWWRDAPFHFYFAWNALGFWLATAALLFTGNRLVSVFAELRGENQLRQEAALGKLLAVALPLPLLLLAVTAAIHALRHQAPLLGQVVTDVRQGPTWARMAMLFPFAVTLHSLYKATQHFDQDLETRATGQSPHH